MEHPTKNTLNLPEYLWWQNVIISDDEEAVETVLKSKSSDEIHNLLNGKFFYEQGGSFSSTSKFYHINNFVNTNNITYPWSLAGAFGAKKVLALFMNNGINMYQKDVQGNIIHSMILRAHLHAGKETTMVDTYEFLKSHLSVEELQILLHAENNMRLRPVEYAAHLGVFHFLLVLYNTIGVYLSHEEDFGLFLKRWYDVTEYESCNLNKNSRHYKSPLISLCMLDKHHLERDSTRHLFSSPFFQAWLSTKTSVNFPVLCRIT